MTTPDTAATDADAPVPGASHRGRATTIPARCISWHARWTTPRSDGLPNAKVVAWFPAVLAVVVGVLTLFSLSGSSTGMFRTSYTAGRDPDLLFGQPRPIRTDEWQVQSSWVVSQVSEGFPRTNHVFPGGMDATLMNDLPTWDWSNAFRPHTWGFLLFGLDHGMAIRWWLPAALMLAAGYLFAVSVLPRRPGLAALLSLVVLFQPDVQWWWLPVVPQPAAFGFMAMAAVVWGLRCQAPLGRWLPSIAAGYLAVDMALGIYVPDMIPAILAAGAFIVGFLLLERRQESLSLTRLVRGLVPLVASGFVALAVVGAWVIDHRDAVQALFATVYPGQRLTPPGSVGKADLVSLMSGPFQRSLQYYDVVPGLGPNQSESATAMMIGIFLAIPMTWLIVKIWRTERRLDWVLVAVLAVQALVLAWMYVPGWGPIAHLTGLDRAVPQRTRLMFVMLDLIAPVLLVQRLDRMRIRVPWVLSIVSGLFVLLVGAWTWRELKALDSTAVPSVYALAVLALLAVAVVALARRRAAPAAILILAASLVVGAGVNPLYRGVFDLRTQTEAGRIVGRMHDRKPDARWVAVGSFMPISQLVESGVPAYSGVQTYPAEPMWNQIDPQHTYETAWNRLARVNWVAGSGDPDPRQPPEGYLDQVVMTFDSCSRFAQKNVTYVLADTAEIDQRCLRQLHSIAQGNVREWIYRVIPVGTTTASAGA